MTFSNSKKNMTKNPQPKCTCKSTSQEAIAKFGHYFDCPAGFEAVSVGKPRKISMAEEMAQKRVDEHLDKLIDQQPQEPIHQCPKCDNNHKAGIECPVALGLESMLVGKQRLIKPKEEKTEQMKCDECACEGSEPCCRGNCHICKYSNTAEPFKESETKISQCFQKIDQQARQEEREKVIREMKEKLPIRKPHYQGKEAGGYAGNETYELVYSSGRVDVIDEVTQKLQDLLGKK